MMNVSGFEPAADDDGATSSMAVAWPASRLCPVAGHVGVKIGRTFLVWGGYYTREEENEDHVEVRDGYRSPASLFIYPAPLNDGCSPNKFGPRSGNNDVWIEIKTTEGDIPNRNSGACAVLCNRKLIVFGGFMDPHALGVGQQMHGEDRSSNLLFELDFSTLRWTRIHYRSYSPEEMKAQKDAEKIPTPRHKMVGWEWENKAYFFGGFGPTPSICSRQYSFLTDHAQFTTDATSASLVSWNNQLLCYDPNSFWSAVACGGSVPSPRAAAAAVKLSDRNQVLLLGGRHNERRLNDIFLLDMTSFVWTEMCDCSITSMQPEGRSWMSLSRIDADRVVMYGGFSNDLVPLSDAWVLDVTRWEWSQLPDSMSGKPRLWHVGAEIDGNVYVYGGVESNILNPNERNNYCSEMLMLPFKPRSLVEQCLNKLSRSYGSVLLEHSSLTAELPRDIRLRLHNRCSLLQDAKINAFKARPVRSNAIASFADVLAL